MEKIFSALALASLLLLGACEKAAKDRPPTVLIGMDGAEWSVIEAMMAKGELPNFRHFREEGAWGRLITTGPSTSPVVWTTFATGEFGRRHGILSHVYPYETEGKKRPVSSELRRSPALWNIASHHGLRSVVTGYFVTHPPEEINGVIVSPLAPGNVKGSVLPEDGLDLESPDFKKLRQQASRRNLARRFLNFDFTPGMEPDPDDPLYPSVEIVNARNLDSKFYKDEFIRRASRQLAQQGGNLFINYYRTVDFMSHSLWLYYDDSDFEDKPDPLLQEHFGETLRETYRYMDEILGEVREQWQGRANIMVVSDHGFGSATGRYQGNQTHLTGNHRTLGIMMATGPDIVPGQVHGMSIMEVAPTLAVLTGLPVSDEWPGRVETSMLREDFFDDHPLESVRNFDYVKEARRTANDDIDAAQQDMSTLRGLGYIEGGIELDASMSVQEYDFWSSDQELLMRIVDQEAVYYLLNGNPQAANEVYDLLLQNRPELARGQLRRIRAQCEEIGDAVEYELDLGPCLSFVEERGGQASDS